MTVEVKDCFEIKANRVGSDHEPGLVVVFEAANCRGVIPAPGDLVRLRVPNGDTFETSVDEVKEHGTGRSFFFGGLKRADVPLGSSIIWEDDRRLWRRAAGAGVGSAHKI